MKKGAIQVTESQEKKPLKVKDIRCHEKASDFWNCLSAFTRDSDGKLISLWGNPCLGFNVRLEETDVFVGTDLDVAIECYNRHLFGDFQSEPFHDGEVERMCMGLSPVQRSKKIRQFFLEDGRSVEVFASVDGFSFEVSVDGEVFDEPGAVKELHHSISKLPIKS